MSEFSIDNQINDNILLKPLSILNRKLPNLMHSLHIFGIHMDDRNAKPFADVRAVLGTPGIARFCSEPYLVISHNVDRPVR